MDMKDLLAKATPGPWMWQAEDECLVGPEQIVLTQDDEGRMTFAQYPDGMHFNNANLIALAPQLASALIEAREALAIALEDLDEWVGCKDRLEKAGFNMDDTAVRADTTRDTLARIDAIMEGRADG